MSYTSRERRFAGKEAVRLRRDGAERGFAVGGTRGRPFPGRILPGPDEVRRQNAEGRSQNGGHAGRESGQGAGGLRERVRGAEAVGVAVAVSVAVLRQAPGRVSEREPAEMNVASVPD
jgi:hypothetical protein